MRSEEGAPWARVAHAAGAGAGPVPGGAVSFPFDAGGAVRGAIEIALQPGHEPASGLVAALAELAADLALTFERLGREEQLRDQLEGARAALAAASARLDETQELAQLGSWELDLVTNSLRWSKEIYRIFEIDPESFGASYEAFLQTVHPQDRALVDGAYRGAVRERKPYHVEHRLLMRDGRIKHVCERGKTFYDANGRPLRSIGTVQDVTAAVMAAQEIRATRDLLQSTVDATPDWIVVLDRAQRFLLVNRSFATAQGRRPEELIGRPAAEAGVLPLGCAGPGADAEDRVLVSGEVVRQPNLPVVLADGSRRVFETLCSPLRASDGQVYAQLCYVRDVTGQAQASAALAEREAQLQRLNAELEQRVANRTEEFVQARDFTEAVLATIGALVVVLDRDGRIVRFNRACEAITGFRAGEVLGRAVWDFLLGAEEVDAVKRQFTQLRAGQFPSRYENHWLTKGGQRRLIEWSNTALTNAHGAVRYIIATGIDVTEQRRAERALQESQAHFQRLAENIREVFWLVAPDRSRLYYLSPAFERVWGRPVEALYTNPRLVFDTIHPDDRPAVEAQLAPQRAGRFEEHYDHEFRILRPDGEIRWIRSRYSPIRNADGVVYQIAGVSEDITEHKEAERRRWEQAARQRDALVREVHHRIKNNLQGVVGLLRQHALRQPALSSALEGAIAQVGTMALVHGLQSRHAGERVFLCDMVEAAAQALAEMRGVPVDFSGARDTTGPILVAAEDAVSIALIVNELLMNAAKHGCGRDRRVRVAVCRRSDGALVEIGNAGGKLPAGFDWARGAGLGTGLQLVRSLLPPRSACLEFTVRDGGVTAMFYLAPPVVEEDAGGCGQD